jgi:hypothetical protein
MPESVAWARPLARSEYRSRLIECFVGMCEGTDDYFSAHAMFARKVLREPWMEAFQIAARLRNTPLTVEAGELLADEWWEPTVKDGGEDAG